jgi:hypothetical protein
MRRVPTIWRVVFPLLVLAPVVAVLGCASGGSQIYADEAYGAGTPQLAVSAFLTAAKQSDYGTMANLFGTEDGPAEVKWGRADVEQRMYVLAALLNHRSYELRLLNVAGEPNTIRVIADMVGTQNGNVSVPFVTISNGGRWFVSQVMTRALDSG